MLFLKEIQKFSFLQLCKNFRKLLINTTQSLRFNFLIVRYKYLYIMGSQTERTIPQFSGGRYSTWKFRIKTLLEELNVSSVIENTLPEKPSAVWIEKNRIAKCTIIKFLGDAFLHVAEGSTTAKSIMDNLDKMYAKPNLFAQLTLRKELNNLKLRPETNLSQHFTIYDNLISKLISAGANLDEMDKICHLLLTLPKSYKGVIGKIELLNKDRFSLAFVKIFLLENDPKKQLEKNTQNQTVVPGSKRPNETSAHIPHKRRKANNYYQQNTNFYRNQYYPQTYCNYCGMQNHHIRNCRFYLKDRNDNQFNWHQQQQSMNDYVENGVPYPEYPKYKRRIRKNWSGNNSNSTTKSLANQQSNVKVVTIKDEPSIKQEPMEVKKEPISIKQEPAWDENYRTINRPIFIKTEPVDRDVTDGPNGNSDVGLRIAETSLKNTQRRRLEVSVVARHIQAEIAATQGEKGATPIVQNS